ncbi:MAG: hypothetical protein EHM35_00530 [Planctomycetaceae bacterium]|nr:MAG: hypothetical protein EHM35_00530 [Planctomycetaceae bacterium]
MYRNRRYGNADPYWLAARFASTCTCGKQIRKGDRIFYYPKTKAAVCETCGRQGANDLRAEQSMDRFGTDCGYDY